MSDHSLDDLIREAEAAVEFGTISLTLKRASGNTTTVDLTRITRRKVDGNVQALTLIGSMLKLLKEAGDTGNLTFTIAMEKGESIQLMTHDFRRANFSNGSYQ